MSGKGHLGYAVARNLEVLETEPLQSSANAQDAEFTELAKAGWWGHNQQVKFTLILSKLLECVVQWLYYGKNKSSLSQRKKIFLMELKSKCYWKLVKLPRKITAIHCPAPTKDSTKIEKKKKISRTYSKMCLKWTEVLGIVL